MITLLSGDNTFEIEQELVAIVRDFDGIAERIDCAELELRQLPDLMMGGTLFADKRLIVIKNLSENKAVWPYFGDWIARISDDISIVLVESRPDKRTTTYKELKKVAQVIDCVPWTDRDEGKAVRWVSEQAVAMNVKLNTKSAQLIVHRVGLDQWALYHALDKLALLDGVTDQVIEQVIDATPSDNVFNLFDAALKGNSQKVASMVQTLELTEDPYRLFALLSSQAFQLAAAAVAEPSDNAAKDLAIHPYVLSKLQPVAKQKGRSGAKKIITIFAEADDDMKLSRAEPWLLIERALLKVASL